MENTNFKIIKSGEFLFNTFDPVKKLIYPY